MAVTYSKLRDSVAGYMHRTPETFYFNGQDLLLQAINNAKNFAQRAVDFELSRTFGQLNGVSPTTGANISSMVYFGTNKTFIVKSLKRAFLGSDAIGTNIFPIDFISRESYVQRLRRQTENALVVGNTQIINTPQMSVSSIQVGQTIYIVPGNIAAPFISIYFDALEWLPDFTTSPISGIANANSFSLVDGTVNFISLGVRVGDLVINTSDGTQAVVSSINSATSLGLNADIFVSASRSYSVYVVSPNQTNFLLDFCFDYMTFRAIWELNYFLKEDARVPLSDTMMKEIWDNVIKWNSTIIANSTDDNDLN
jgi:hypothetical protein